MKSSGLLYFTDLNVFQYTLLGILKQQVIKYTWRRLENGIQHNDISTYDGEFPSIPYFDSCFIGRDCNTEIEDVGL